MLRLFNTLTRSVDTFETIEPGKVRLYTCGPTVYNFAHIGNLRTYVFEDILKRSLCFLGYTVNHVMNVTDVGHLVSDADTGEDKMEMGAQREGKSVWDIAEYYFQVFRRHMDMLNLLEPDLWCKATDHIAEQIDLVRALEQKGYTYTLADGIYYDTSKFADYGRLARLDRDGLMAGARIEMVEGKRHPTDFALWKFSPHDKKRMMEWDSPWGVGFPGWHSECCAMAMKYLGDEIDIHCGGIDHIAVHHTNEIAQSEAVTGKQWVRFWMHGEFLVMAKEGPDDNERMSKSSGNFITLDTLVEQGYDPLVYRYFCLNAHYRSPLTFSWEALDGAVNAYQRLKAHVIELGSQMCAAEEASHIHLDQFRAALEDDLNMPRALSVMWSLVRDPNVSGPVKMATLRAMDPVLGFNIEAMKRTELELDQDIQQLVCQREDARKARDFGQADLIRAELLARGYVIEDSPEGPRLKRSSPCN